MTDKTDGTNRKPERDGNGRFVKGNNGGPGRPTKEKCISDLMAVYLERETVAQVKDSLGRRRKRKTTFLEMFVESQITRAINGDAAAAKNVWDRIEGKVAVRLEHSGGPEGFHFVVEYVGGESD